jgi:hypothetical protein
MLTKELVTRTAVSWNEQSVIKNLQLSSLRCLPLSYTLSKF